MKPVSHQWQLNAVFFSRFVIIACLGMSDPYWPLIIEQHQSWLSSAAIQYWSAAIYIVPFLITIITTPFWTRLGARVGHKKMLLRATIALFATQYAVAYLTDPMSILLMRALQGFFAGFNVAGQAWSINKTKAAMHSHIVGRLQAWTAIGTIAGPLFGGFIAHAFSYQMVFEGSAICCLLVTGMLWLMLDETEKQTPKMNETRVGLSNIGKANLHLLALICLTQAARFMLMPFFALYAIQQLHGSTMTVGILYSSIALMIFIAAPRLGRLLDQEQDSSSLVRTVLIGALLNACFAQCLFVTTHTVYLALIASLIFGLSIGATSVVPYTLLVRNAKEHQRSDVIGYGTSASKLGNLLGVGLGAALQAIGGFQLSFAGIAVVYLLLAIWVGKVKLPVLVEVQP